jgi:molecular chaperone DnaK (HSP70)
VSQCKNITGQLLVTQESGGGTEETLCRRKLAETEIEIEKEGRNNGIRNRLEKYLFAVNDTLKNEKASSSLSAEDKEKIIEVLEEGLKWLEEHPHDERDVYDDEFKKVQEVITPLLGEIGATGTKDSKSSARQSSGESGVEHDDL